MLSDIEEPGRRRLVSALLWGLVGFFSVLVAVQAYALLFGPLLSIGQGAALALAVGIVTSIVVYATEHRLTRWAARRAGGD